VAGVTAIVNSVGATTERLDVALTESSVAVITVDPTPWPVATPAFIVAAVMVDEVHTAAALKSCVEPSLNVPVAV
jgi:hypothetical protein